MKRIKAACLEQTIHFLLKDDLPHEEAVKFAEAEYAHYLAQLERSRTEYRIPEKAEQPDGSPLVKLKKQYGKYTCLSILLVFHMMLMHLQKELQPLMVMLKISFA